MNKPQNRTVLNLAILLVISLLSFASCNDDSPEIIEEEMEEESPSPTPDFYRAVDLSEYPDIAKFGTQYYDETGQPQPLLSLLKDAGVNTVRLKLWVDPLGETGSFNQVQAFAEEIKARGFMLWLTVHYSDTWADPGRQEKPSRWEGLSFDVLKDSVYQYTAEVASTLQPDVMQVGNEINPGFLLPEGDRLANPSQFIGLLNEGIRAIRQQSPDTKIMLHYAGINGANNLFEQVKDLSYDLMGMSYYPIWHGKSLSSMSSTLTQMSIDFGKGVVIAETAYPFTLGWNDWTNNIVGLDEHLILPDYPATSTGQLDFIKEVRNQVEAVPAGKGFCYWGGALVAFNGNESTEGSPWENQALFDFDNQALPVLEAFEAE